MKEFIKDARIDKTSPATNKQKSLVSAILIIHFTKQTHFISLPSKIK